MPGDAAFISATTRTLSVISGRGAPARPADAPKGLYPKSGREVRGLLLGQLGRRDGWRHLGPTASAALVEPLPFRATHACRA